MSIYMRIIEKDMMEFIQVEMLVNCVQNTHPVDVAHRIVVNLVEESYHFLLILCRV